LYVLILQRRPISFTVRFIVHFQLPEKSHLHMVCCLLNTE
jgi:hypothetical protein